MPDNAATSLSWVQRLWREPLGHFLLVGLLMFLVFEAMDKEERSDPTRHIVVDDVILARFLQVRSKTASDKGLNSYVRELPADELQQLIDEFVREEAMYREAKTLQLDAEDPGVRHRMVSQLQFINEGVVDASIELSEEDLHKFLADNEQRYYQPPHITLTHVFLNAERRGVEAAQTMARESLRRLNGTEGKSPVPFHEAPAHGDRFLYRQNYVDRELSEIKSHFGGEMQRQLFELTPDEKRWRGPFRSPYGFHLVLVTRRTDSQLPPWKELRKRLELDARQARLDEELRNVERTVVESYDVEIADALQRRLHARAGRGNSP